MPEMVIHVDTSTDWSRPDARTWRGRHPVPTVLVLALAVLAVLTGPHLLRNPNLALTWQIKASTRFFWLTGQAVYTLDSPGDGTVDLSAHDLGNQHVVWQLPLTGPLARAYADANPVFAGDLPPNGTDGVRTTVSGSTTTQIFPAAAVPLVYLVDDLIVTIDRDPASGPSDAAQSPNGLVWTHVVTVRDLATRQVVWTGRLPAGVRWALPGVRAGTAGIVGLPAGAHWMVTWTDAGTVQLRDLRTGAVLASREVGALTGRSYVTALTGSVVVGQDPGDGDDRLTGYDARTLAPLWRLHPALANAEPVSCDPDMCLVNNRAIWFVEPTNGVVTSRIDGTEVRPGPAGAAVVSPFGQNTSVVLTAAGIDTQLDGVWRMVDATAYGPDAVVVQVHDLGRADLGLLDVRRAQVLRLGQINQWSAYYACLAVDQTVACDDGNVVTVWRRGSA